MSQERSAAGHRGFRCVQSVRGSGAGLIQTHEEQATIRSRIGAYEATEVARIKAGEAVLKDYFSQVFAERRSLYYVFPGSTGLSTMATAKP